MTSYQYTPKSIVEILSDEGYKLSLINSLCGGIDSKWLPEFIDIIEYVIDKKLPDILKLDIIKESLYDGEEETGDLILPSVRRVFGKVFIQPPTVLDGDRLELFRLHFNIDEFLDYLIETLIKTKNVLKDFPFLDQTSETLTLIVDNYVAELFYKTTHCDDRQQEIRDLKINKLKYD